MNKPILKNAKSKMKGRFLGSACIVALTTVVAYAWDTLDANFPREDTPSVQMVNSTPTNLNNLVSYASSLGYSLITLEVNPFFAAPYQQILTGLPTGNPAPVRATLALMADALQPFPILFPDWAPGGNWMPPAGQSGSGLWQTNFGDHAFLQRQYELFMSVPPGVLMSPAALAANQAGSLAVSNFAPGTPPAPFLSYCNGSNGSNPGGFNGLEQPLVLYSAYGNAVGNFVPTTLQDDGPLPNKDERAWPLPYDLCIY